MWQQHENAENAVVARVPNKALQVKVEEQDETLWTETVLMPAKKGSLSTPAGRWRNHWYKSAKAVPGHAPSSLTDPA
jgi:hypothetical protein